MQFASLLLAALLTLIALPASAQSSSIVFMQIADPQMGMFSNNHGSQKEIADLTAVVNEATRLHPAFLVVCGDLMNSSTSAGQLKSFRDTISRLKGVPVHLVSGNHDVGNQPTPARVTIYRQRFGPDYYEFRSGPLIGIVLDSMVMGDPKAPEESARQYAWLKKTLVKASIQKNEQIAVFQHKPFFLHTPNEPDSYWNVPLAARTRYLALLERYGVKHVFAGHLHYPLNAQGDGLEIVVAGATGKPLGHSVSGLNLVQVNSNRPWVHHWFPLTAMPRSLTPPW